MEHENRLKRIAIGRQHLDAFRRPPRSVLGDRGQSTSASSSPRAAAASKPFPAAASAPGRVAALPTISDVGNENMNISGEDLSLAASLARAAASWGPVGTAWVPGTTPIGPPQTPVSVAMSGSVVRTRGHANVLLRHHRCRKCSHHPFPRPTPPP